MLLDEHGEAMVGQYTVYASASDTSSKYSSGRQRPPPCHGHPRHVRVTRRPSRHFGENRVGAYSGRDGRGSDHLGTRWQQRGWEIDKALPSCQRTSRVPLWNMARASRNASQPATGPSTQVQ